MNARVGVLLLLLVACGALFLLLTPGRRDQPSPLLDSLSPATETVFAS